MFDPRSPYHRRRWHYDSDQPLSVAQLIAAGSLDAFSAALIWLSVERHRSLIVSGPTDPTPGIGKTTTLNALLEFLPAGTTLVYTMGMYEDFDFIAQTEASTTCVLANEVSDHLPIYMWGRVARKLLRLPADDYAIATSCHADTIDDVLFLLRRDLRLTNGDLSQLGMVVNIGLVGRIWPPRRRFLSIHYLCASDDSIEKLRADQLHAVSTGAPASPVDQTPLAVLRLGVRDGGADCLTRPDAPLLAALAPHLDLSAPELDAALQRRTAVLQQLSAGHGAGIQETRRAIEQVMHDEATTQDQAASSAPAPSESDDPR